MNAMMNVIHVVGNVLLHSLRTAAFFWVAAGLAAEVLVIRSVTKKKSGKKQDDTYSLEGMSLGMCLGLLIGTMLKSYAGAAIFLGMFAGLVIGTCIPKKAGEEDE